MHKVDRSNDKSVPALIAALKDDGSGSGSALQAYAAEALGQIGSAAKDAVPALTEALKDEDKSVGERAQNALDTIQAPQ